jgi:hypothetical protein
LTSSIAAACHRLSILNEHFLSISVPFTSGNLFNSIKCNTISPCGSSCLSVSEELVHCSWWHKVSLQLPHSAASFVWGALRILKLSPIFFLFSDQMWQRLLSYLAEFCTLIHFSSTQLSMYNLSCSFCFATSSGVHFYRDNHLYSQLLSFHL